MVSNPHNTLTNPLRIPPIGEPEYILRSQKSFQKLYQCEDLGQFDKAKWEPIHATDQASKSLNREDPASC